MPSMKPNLVARIERLPKPTRTSEALQPLFEAISNSIHSVQKKYGEAVHKKGAIRVIVEIGGRKKSEPAVITVQDNGIGLDEQQFEAFTTTDTDNKIEIGGKGVGRLLWLDCFESIQVESIYESTSGKKRRKFEFKLANSDQIQNLEDSQAPLSAETGMLVTFSGFRHEDYRKRFPGRGAYVFQHLTSHFLPTFIGDKSPELVVTCGDETKTYPGEIASIVSRREDIKAIASSDFGSLDLTLLECEKVASSDLPGNHFVHFIAHDRTVLSQKIDGKLGFKYFGASADRVFHACLTGAFLNKNVNQERTKFLFEDAVVERIVNETCFPHIELFLADALALLRGNQREIVEKISANYPSVAFAEPDALQEHLPIGELNPDAIYGHLSRERFRRDDRQAAKIRHVLSRLKSEDIDENSISAAIQEATKAIEEAEQRSLAEYVVRRKIVLDFLEVLVEKVKVIAADSSYQREDILHSFICPVRVTSVGADGVAVKAATSHDLWIIDERLTFARYFSSDVSFASLAAAYETEERPDLIVFDRVHGLRQKGDPSKVMLVEFKRPGRKTYADDENPQQQVERYVRRLLSGVELDVKGRPIALTEDTIFYCFIVADIVGKMDEWTYTWSRTADGRGRFYQPRHGFKGSIELIGWDALISDARLRNQAFFDSAGIPGKSLFSDD